MIGSDLHWHLIGSEFLLRAAARRGALILCFHQISLQAFRVWMESLFGAFSLVSLEELVERRERRRPLAGLMAVTFDDGWADTCHPVAQMCEARGWPITIYLIAGLFGAQRRLWFGELPDVLRQATDRCFEVDGELIDLRSGAFARTKARLDERLRQLSGAEAIQFIDRVRAAAGICRGADIQPFVGVDFVRRYAHSDCVSFGSHTVDHQALAIQPDLQVACQFTESRLRLEDLTGRPVGHLCYPYGYPRWIGDTAPRIAGGIYRSATTMVRGLCTDQSDPWYLPRVSFYQRDSIDRGLAKIALALAR
jgi:peptidoglycan/xylan/chitin deacetylase (PgdA/CDA1 family)